MGLVIDESLDARAARVADNNSNAVSLPPTSDLRGNSVEERHDRSGLRSRVGISHDGREYDAGLMAVAWEGPGLQVAAVIGQRTDDGLRPFTPGDIMINSPPWRLGDDNDEIRFGLLGTGRGSRALAVVLIASLPLFYLGRYQPGKTAR